jgi:hypothetical protein
VLKKFKIFKIYNSSQLQTCKNISAITTFICVCVLLLQSLVSAVRLEHRAPNGKVLHFYAPRSKKPKLDQHDMPPLNTRNPKERGTRICFSSELSSLDVLRVSWGWLIWLFIILLVLLVGCLNIIISLNRQFCFSHTRFLFFVSSFSLSLYSHFGN